MDKNGVLVNVYDIRTVLKQKNSVKLYVQMLKK